MDIIFRFAGALLKITGDPFSEPSSNLFESKCWRASALGKQLLIERKCWKASIVEKQVLFDGTKAAEHYSNTL